MALGTWTRVGEVNGQWTCVSRRGASWEWSCGKCGRIRVGMRKEINKRPACGKCQRARPRVNVDVGFVSKTGWRLLGLADQGYRWACDGCGRYPWAGTRREAKDHARCAACTKVAADAEMAQRMGEQRACATCGQVRPGPEYRRGKTKARWHADCLACAKARWARMTAVHGKRYLQERKARVFDKLGRACFCCGETRERLLSVDHLNDDGAKVRREKLYTDSWTEVEKNAYDPSRYAIACFNCNMARGIHGVCPHQEERAAAVTHMG